MWLSSRWWQSKEKGSPFIRAGACFPFGMSLLNPGSFFVFDGGRTRNRRWVTKGPHQGNCVSGLDFWRLASAMGIRRVIFEAVGVSNIGAILCGFVRESKRETQSNLNLASVIVTSHVTAVTNRRL